jgi:hypothetical protein
MKAKSLNIIVFFLLLSQFSFGQQPLRNSIDSILTNFKKPKTEAKPRVWWHWMNGNITKEGIRKDLLWMNKIGIGGFHNFDAGLTTPQVVNKRLTYMTPEWKDAFGYATKLADSLSFEMAIAGSPGWSESGGSWVKPKDGMKKIVWSEIVVQGGMYISSILPQPPSTTGPFQNVSMHVGYGVTEPIVPTTEFYQDIAVIAYRIPQYDQSVSRLNPKITSSAGNFTFSQLTDGDLATTNLLPLDSKTGYAWIQYEFEQTQTIKAVSVVGGGNLRGFGVPEISEERAIEVSNDGINFQRIAYIPLSTVIQQTVSIKPTMGKYFRIVFKNPGLPRKYEEAPTNPILGTNVAEIVLHTSGRVNHFEEKAGFGAGVDVSKFPTPETSDAVLESDVLVITDKVNSNGFLNWTAPEGDWKVLRMGFSLTGKLNHPASPEATGLEVDKLDPMAVKDYFENYLDQYKSATGGLMGEKGLQYVITDSYESGQENWTLKMAEEFQKRRGYNLLKWMPVLTGTIIKNAEASEQFLWDFRKTISELIVENHYDLLTDILAKRKMKRYTESHENGRVYIVDGMEVKKKAAIPMSAMWTSGGSTNIMAEADVRESASVAHIYGQNIVAAESFTSVGFNGNAWGYSPEKLKSTADLEMANGLNRFVIHTSVHQPVDDKIPGLSLGIFGQWFNRHETWASQAGVWVDYLARSSYLLQQGKFVADIAYYYGEDNNITFLFGEKLPEIPKGYNYDFINADALINVLQVKNGQLVTPSGMIYRMLVLDENSRRMTLKVVRKLRDLVQNGAVIVGPKPTNTPSLMDDKDEFNRIVDELWGINSKIYSKESVKEVLQKLGISNDFEYTSIQDNTDVRFVHRSIDDGEIYWINNRQKKELTIEGRFRVSGKEPEIWHPEDGSTEKVSYLIQDGMTFVPLQLQSEEAVFIIFRKNTNKSKKVIISKTVKKSHIIGGNWLVSFKEAQPHSIGFNTTFRELVSFHKNTDKRIKYFSGTAVYRNSFKMNQLDANADYQIDLEDVENIAEVIINEKNIGTVWKAPFRLSLQHALRIGKNTIQINVTNLWVNRLIGDMQPDETTKNTYISYPFYKADMSLVPSGLIGSVRIDMIK